MLPCSPGESWHSRASRDKIHASLPAQPLQLSLDNPSWDTPAFDVQFSWSAERCSLELCWLRASQDHGSSLFLALAQHRVGSLKEGTSYFVHDGASA